MGEAIICAIMKIELCSYSGIKIYPGHGKRMVKVDGRVYHFLSKKCERSHAMKRNPREITWTVLYRRKHKKGQTEEVVKKRTRRTHKFQREQAIRAYKEKQKQKEATKKATKPAPAKSSKGGQPKAAKNVQAKAPRVGGK